MPQSTNPAPAMRLHRAVLRYFSNANLLAIFDDSASLVLGQPLQGSIAERYLREARAYRGPLPPTLGFLPARADYPPAMIAAFGIPDEPETGTMVLPEHKLVGVHLTRLLPDGSDRERDERAKIMIGHSKGRPIVLAPPTNGLAIVVAEGIESTLSGHEE